MKAYAWTPDLWGGAYKERGEAKTRFDQLDYARQEMRDTGSDSLLDLLVRKNESEEATR